MKMQRICAGMASTCYLFMAVCGKLNLMNDYSIGG